MYQVRLLSSFVYENEFSILEKMVYLYESKKELFQKALGIAFSEVATHKKLDNKNMISFHYFKRTLHPKELRGCIQFIQVVSSYAEKNKTVSQKKNQNQNDKFMMRTWLMRAEYKFARKNIDTRVRKQLWIAEKSGDRGSVGRVN